MLSCELPAWYELRPNGLGFSQFCLKFSLADFKKRLTYIVCDFEAEIGHRHDRILHHTQVSVHFFYCYTLFKSAMIDLNHKEDPPAPRPALQHVQPGWPRGSRWNRRRNLV